MSLDKFFVFSEMDRNEETGVTLVIRVIRLEPNEITNRDSKTETET